uniref:J domain-containing protein n=1 Tax=Kalanchoe fedtschenkoi TaxID=63787 RepID=A0A7N0UR59_KALFE
MDGRDEAARWINLALKLLVNRDLVGTKTFAIRAKEADPGLEYAEEILAVVDTLMAGQQQINGRYDWYGILQVGRMCGDAEMMAGQYRRLALLLNPQRNGLPFAEEAFGLVTEAWSVLSNPLRKSLYDNELSWLDSSGSGSMRVQQHQFLPMQSHSQQQHNQQPQAVAPVRAQPQVVTPLRAQVQQQHAQVQRHAPQQQQPQPQPQVHYLPQFQPPPQPQVQSQPQPPPQTQARPQPQQQLWSQPQPQKEPQQRPHGQQQPQKQKEPQQRPLGQQQPQQQKDPQQRPQSQQPQPQQRAQEPGPVQGDPHPPVWKTPARNEREEVVDVEDEEEPAVDPLEADAAEVSTFWTACPYCYHLYEFLKEYEDCTLRCQNKNCRRAFHGSAVAPPPEIKSSKEASFCSWGFFPVGATPIFLNSGKNKSGGHSWLPFSPMFTCPVDPSKGASPVVPSGGFGGFSARKSFQARPKAVIYDDVEYALMELSDSSDDSDADWGRNGLGRRKKRGRGRPPKGKSPASRSAKHGTVEKSSGFTDGGDRARGSNGSTQDAFGNGGGAAGVSESGVTTMTSIKSASNGNGSFSKKASGKNPKDLGKLDLNVEFSNEVEETVSAKCGITNAGASTGAGTSTAAAPPSNGAEENIEAEGIGFFEGLDEFLNSLPILSSVGDDKVKAA